MTLTVVTKFDASGAIFQHGEIRGTFTSSASGKSIVFQNSETEKTTAPIDNGDGTLSFVLHGTGMIRKLSVLNGPPFRMFAGERDILFTVDAATGDENPLQWPPHGRLVRHRGLQMPPSGHTCCEAFAANLSVVYRPRPARPSK